MPRLTAAYLRKIIHYDPIKGVGWHKREQKYRAYIGLNGRHIHLGYFDDPNEAHIAYCTAAKKYFGKFARAR